MHILSTARTLSNNVFVDSERELNKHLVEMQIWREWGEWMRGNTYVQTFLTISRLHFGGILFIIHEHIHKTEEHNFHVAFLMS